MAAVRRLEQGVSIRDVARGREAGPNVLHRWRREFGQGPGNAIDNWRMNRIKAVEENIFAWGFGVDHSTLVTAKSRRWKTPSSTPSPACSTPSAINKISLYESRLSRIIARNTDLLNKSHRESSPQNQTAAATTQPNQSLTFRNGFDQNDIPATPADVPKAA